MENELTDKNIIKLCEFIREAILLTDEENAALKRIIPMTDKMYKRLRQRLLDIGCEERYKELVFEYPEFEAD